VIDPAHSCTPPDYPPAAKRLGQTGAVIVKFLIEEDGSVADSQIETSSGYPRLDEAAREALSLCSFKAGTVDGRPERSWVQIRYVWKLN
jgi:protein TonB